MCLSLFVPDGKLPFPKYWVPLWSIVPVVSFANFPFVDEDESLVKVYVRSPFENDVLTSIKVLWC